MALNIADTVQLKPHYSQHIADNRCAYLFSETSSYILNGRVYTLLVPLINSPGITVEDVIKKTCDAVSPEYVFFALNQMLEENLITTGRVANDAEDIYWWVNDISPSVARANLARQQFTICSFGVPDGLGRALSGMLENAGFKVDSGDVRAFSILLTNDYLNKDLAARIRALSAQKITWLVVKPVGKEVWIGPSSTHGDVCWDCVTVRLMENRLGQHVLPDDVTAGSTPPVALLPIQRDFALSLVTAYLAQRTGLGRGIDTGQCIRVLNVDTLKMTDHYILVNPACSCNKQAAQHREQLHLDFQNSFTRYENGYRMNSAIETYSRISRLVSPVSGLIPELCRSDQYDSSYIYYARHGFTVSEELSANRIAGKPSWACGKGSTDIDARVSCIAEAIERYSSGFFGNEATRRARIDELENAIHPDGILLFSESQYADRDAANSSSGEFDWIPERFNPELSIEWKQCASLDDGGDAYIPARLCYLNYPDGGGHVFCRADSNGCATGNTVEEALLFGLFELVERDAVSIWWFNKLTLPRVDLASFGDHSIDRVIESLKLEARELVVLDITTDLGIYTFACVSWCGANSDQIYIGYGTHLDSVIAIKRALNEVIQVASYLKENDISGHPALDKWLHKTSLENMPFLAGDERVAKPKGHYSRLTTGNLVSDISKCVDLLAGSNLRAYFVDMTRGDALLPTARVIVPGLRHFWPRFAPGRLYDVPYESGLLGEKMQEHDLNRYFYPL